MAISIKAGIHKPIGTQMISDQARVLALSFAVGVEPDLKGQDGVAQAGKGEIIALADENGTVGADAAGEKEDHVNDRR